jgi:hypothetical protein
LAVVGTWSRGVPSWQEDHSNPSNSKVLGRKRRWRGEDLVGPSKFVGTLYLPSSLLACIIPFNWSILVGRAAAGGGQLSLGGIQLGTDMEIVPSCPQRTTRLLLLWEVGLLVGISLGLSSGQHEVLSVGLVGDCWEAFLYAGHRKTPAWEVRLRGRACSPGEPW